MDSVFRRGRGQFPLEQRPGAGRAGGERGARGAAGWRSGSARADLQQMTLLDDGRRAGEAARGDPARADAWRSADGLAHRWEHFARDRQPAATAPTGCRWTRPAITSSCAPRRWTWARAARLLWSKRTCVLTSATLAVDGGFEFVKRELGIERDAGGGRWARRSTSRTRRCSTSRADLPMPNDPGFTEAVVPRDRAHPARLTRGRAFVLFTSYRALREVAPRWRTGCRSPARRRRTCRAPRLIEWFKTTPQQRALRHGDLLGGRGRPGRRAVAA